MPDLSSLKTPSPFLQKHQLDQAGKFFRQPLGIAILASLGVHGLLWFGLPFLPSAESQQPDARTLNIVELSPLEQARLPQSSLYQPTPLPLPESDPKSPKAAADPLADPLSLSPSDPVLANPMPYYEIPGLTGSVGDRSWSATSSNQRSTTTSRSAGTTQKSSPPTTEPETEPETEPGTESETATKTPPAETQTEAPQNDAQADTPSKKAADLKDPSGEDYSKSREDQPPKQEQALANQYAFNPAGTTDQEISDNAIAASEKLAEKFNVKEWQKKITTTATYPKEACQFQQDGKPIKGTTSLAIVVQPDGTLADTALMIRSSGFKGLDDAAVKFVQNQWSQIATQNKVEAGSQPKVFPIEINFDPATADCANAPKTS